MNNGLDLDGKSARIGKLVKALAMKSVEMGYSPDELVIASICIPEFVRVALGDLPNEDAGRLLNQLCMKVVAEATKPN